MGMEDGFQFMHLYIHRWRNKLFQKDNPIVIQVLWNQKRRIGEIGTHCDRITAT